jgi:hypothetical protein
MDHTTLKVPFELLNRAFRLRQKQVCCGCRFICISLKHTVFTQVEKALSSIGEELTALLGQPQRDNAKIESLISQLTALKQQVRSSDLPVKLCSISCNIRAAGRRVWGARSRQY